jgi:pyruvate kinase
LKKTKIIATLGPSTNTPEMIRKIKDKDVDFVRINMSHSSIEDLQYFISLAKSLDVSFVLDTEGSQIRTGSLDTDSLVLKEGDKIELHSEQFIGNQNKISLRPKHIVKQLERGDLIHIDFDTAILRVSEPANLSNNHVVAKVVTGGIIGKNKAVVVDSGSMKKFILPVLSEKDGMAIELGINEEVGHIAVSFVRCAEDVEKVRRATKGTMKIISKIECVDALNNIDEIIEASDYLLIDRGDLSKEIPIEKIPFTQKIILNKARKMKTPVFVATNLLETMIEKRKPTRAEVHDITNTILDGAHGLTLAAETAIGKYPLECINMLNKLIYHTESSVILKDFESKEDEIVSSLQKNNYLKNSELSSSLVEPHGGKLVDRMIKSPLDLNYLNSLKRIHVGRETLMDIEQIGIGTFSPLEGFMGSGDLKNVLDTMRLKGGVPWSIPIVLDISVEKASTLFLGEEVVLADDKNNIIAILHLDEKFIYEKSEFAEKLYGTLSQEHPGVRTVMNMGEVLLAGKIDLLRRVESENKEYELTPKQVRRLFEERGWSKIVGFHTRNVIHRSHEFIQLAAMNNMNCDGLFVHPVVGKKKPGDFQAMEIIKSYDIMTRKYYPKDKVIFSTFATFSRYAGPREALFTAICRKNFGCSHFIVGRDHTGVGNFYSPTASQDIFNKFPDLGVKAVPFGEVYYSDKLKTYVSETEKGISHEDLDKLKISGTQARQMLQNLQSPPEWFMRPEISDEIIKSISEGREVFVK